MGPIDRRLSDIRPQHVSCAVFPDQEMIDAAGSTAEIQHLTVPQVHIFKYTRDLFRASRR
jgi:hypothetical protein